MAFRLATLRSAKASGHSDKSDTRSDGTDGLSFVFGIIVVSD